MAKKILIIDDNEADQRIIQEMVTDAKISAEFSRASTGEEGIKVACEIKPDILIIDTRLPGIDGFEVCKQVREIEDYNPKIIITTGVIDAVDAGKARQFGADDYCVKTFDCEPLLNVIKTMV